MRIEIRPDLGNRRHIWAIDTKTEVSAILQEPIRKNADTYPQKRGEGIRKNADNNIIYNNTNNIESAPPAGVPICSTTSVQPISNSLPVQPISNHVAIPTAGEIKPSQLEENGAATSDGRCADFDQTTLPESYTTDTELRALMSRYYKGNPQEYEVGILNDAKGQRIGADGIKDCMVMWAAWMIENNKLRMQAHQLHQSFKRWVLREATTYKKHDTKTQDDKPATVSLNTKNFTFQ